MWTEIWAVLLTCCGQNCGNDRGLTPRGPQGGLGPWRHPGPPLCPLWGFVRPQGSREPGATRATRTGRGDRGAVELLAGLLFGEIFMAPKKKKSPPENARPTIALRPRDPTGPVSPVSPPPPGALKPWGPWGTHFFQVGSRAAPGALSSQGDSGALRGPVQRRVGLPLELVLRRLYVSCWLKCARLDRRTRET